MRPDPASPNASATRSASSDPFSPPKFGSARFSQRVDETPGGTSCAPFLLLSRGSRTPLSPRAESGPGSLSQLSGPPLADARPQYSTRTHKKQKAPVAIRGLLGNQPHSLVGGQVSLASLIASDPDCSTGL